MKKYINFLLLRTFGIKPKQNKLEYGVFRGKTIVNCEQNQGFNLWIRGIYGQLNKNLC